MRCLLVGIHIDCFQCVGCLLVGIHIDCFHCVECLLVGMTLIAFSVWDAPAIELPVEATVWSDLNCLR